MALMKRPRSALAVLIAVVVAAGCGSDDDEPKTGGSDEPEKEAQSAAPKPTSARAKLVKCIDREGFEVTHEGQAPAEATNYTVEGDDPKGRPRATIKIHSNRDDARGSAARAGEERGVNSVPFGRAEFIPKVATDTETGRIVNCVSLAYGG